VFKHRAEVVGGGTRQDAPNFSAEALLNLLERLGI
jgi:hypothetical protein